MSKMSELLIEIQQLLSDGYSPSTVAQALGIPLSWVITESIEEPAPEMFDDVQF